MKTLVLVLVLVTLTACGGNPDKVAKDRDRADKRVREGEVRNAELEKHAQVLETALRNAVATTNFIWALPTSTTQHATAVAACAEIGFTLPTTAELAEYKREIYDRDTDLQKVSFDRFYAADVAEDQTEIFGFVLCRRPVKSSAL